MENGMQTVIRGASQLQVTRSRMAPGSSAGTGGRWTSRLPVEAVQPPYHLFRRDIEAGLLPYAAAYHIGVLAYGPLAHGLLGGTLYSLLTGQVTVTGAVRQATVGGDPGIARRALEPLAGAFSKPSPTALSAGRSSAPRPRDQINLRSNPRVRHTIQDRAG